MKKLALILAFVMCFTSTMFFSGCNKFLKPNVSDITDEIDKEEIPDTNPNKIDQSVQSQEIDGKTWYFVYTARDLYNLLGMSIHIKLCNNIDISTYNTWKWKNYNNCIFDGQGYTITFKPTISNLQKNFALFESTSNSTIQNLTINTQVQAYECAAGLVCFPSKTKINNCTVVNSSITTKCMSNSGYWVWAGGFVGKLSTGTQINNCILLNSLVNITNNDGDSGSYVFMCGGIAGECDTTSLVTNCLTSNTYSTKKISCMSDSDSLTFKNKHQVSVGGIVGSAYNKIENCYNSSIVDGGNSKYTNISYAGGIAGYSTAGISKCGNTGTITALACSHVENANLEFLNSGSASYQLDDDDANIVTPLNGSFDIKYDGESGGHVVSKESKYMRNGSFYLYDATEFSIDMHVSYCENRVMDSYASGIANTSYYVSSSYSTGNLYGGYSYNYIVVNLAAYTRQTGSSSSLSLPGWRSIQQFQLYVNPISLGTKNNCYFSGEFETADKVNISHPSTPVSDIVYKKINSDDIYNYNISDSTILQLSKEDIGKRDINFEVKIIFSDNYCWMHFEYKNVSTYDNTKVNCYCYGNLAYFNVLDINPSNSSQYDISRSENFLDGDSEELKDYFATKFLKGGNYSYVDHINKSIFDVFYWDGTGPETYFTEDANFRYFGDVTNPYCVVYEVKNKNITNLSSLNVNTKAIGVNAFKGITSLTGELKISDSIEFIGRNAFNGCTNISKIILGTNVKTIDNDAFNNCTNAQTLEMKSSNITNIGSSAFRECSKLSGVNIPKSVEIIGNGAFSGCTNMQTLTFATNSKLRTIDSFAFYNCKNIATLTIPKSVEEIWNYAFEGCSKLYKLQIPADSVLTKIGIEAFKNCSNLSEVELLSVGLLEVFKNVFDGCTKITSFTIGCKLSIFDTLASDRDFNSSLKNVTITDTATGTIKKSTFGKFTNIIKLHIGAKISKIESKTFYTEAKNTSVYASLTTVTFAEGTVKLEIGDRAFFNCDGLTSIVLPARVDLLLDDDDNSYAFAACDNLTNFLVKAGTSAVWDETLNDADGDGDNEWNYKIEFEYDGTKSVYKSNKEWDEVTRYEDRDVRWTLLYK